MLFRSIVTSEDPSNRVFVDGNAESEGDLLSDAGTPPGGVVELHLEDGLNNFLTRSFGSRSAPALGGEKEAIFSILQGLMKGEKGGGFEYDRRTDEADGPEERAHRLATRRSEVRRLGARCRDRLRMRS
jgi:hypothetical protein